MKTLQQYIEEKLLINKNYRNAITDCLVLALHYVDYSTDKLFIEFDITDCEELSDGSVDAWIKQMYYKYSSTCKEQKFRKNFKKGKDNTYKCIKGINNKEPKYYVTILTGENAFELLSNIKENKDYEIDIKKYFNEDIVGQNNCKLHSKFAKVKNIESIEKLYNMFNK